MTVHILYFAFNLNWFLYVCLVRRATSFDFTVVNALVGFLSLHTTAVKQINDDDDDDDLDRNSVNSYGELSKRRACSLHYVMYSLVYESRSRRPLCDWMELRVRREFRRKWRRPAGARTTDSKYALPLLSHPYDNDIACIQDTPAVYQLSVTSTPSLSRCYAYAVRTLSTNYLIIIIHGGLERIK